MLAKAVESDGIDLDALEAWLKGGSLKDLGEMGNDLDTDDSAFIEEGVSIIYAWQNTA